MDRMSNAVNSLEACRAVLAQLGEHGAVQALRGVEIHSAGDALMALSTLQGIRVSDRNARHACLDAIGALKIVAERYPQLRAVA